MTPNAGDRLLDAWLSLTSTLWNTRLVSSMTYNECHILGILLRRKEEPQTATTLIAHTHLLKSQMNKVLTTLEGKGFITRERAQHDRRLSAQRGQARKQRLPRLPGQPKRLHDELPPVPR